jgi:hypothetical protein
MFWYVLLYSGCSLYTQCVTFGNVLLYSCCHYMHSRLYLGIFCVTVAFHYILRKLYLGLCCVTVAVHDIYSGLCLGMCCCYEAQAHYWFSFNDGPTGATTAPWGRGAVLEKKNTFYFQVVYTAKTDVLARKCLNCSMLCKYIDGRWPVCTDFSMCIQER